MKLDIIKETEIPLFKRKRVSCMVDFAGATPSNEKLRESLATKMKVNKNQVAVRHIYQRFGLPRAKIIAHVYKDFETLKKVEKLSEKTLANYIEKKEEAKEEQ